jgi:predicted transcriptional regulator
MPSSCKAAFTAKQVERLRHMKSEGLRHHEIARIMGVATNTVSAYLSGQRVPKGQKSNRSHS